MTGLAVGDYGGILALSSVKPSMFRDNGQCIVSILAVVTQHWLMYAKPDNKQADCVIALSLIKSSAVDMTGLVLKTSAGFL